MRPILALIAFLSVLAPLDAQLVGGRWEKKQTWIGGPAANGLGASIALLDDLTGDGFPEVLIGAPAASPGGLASAGAVVVLDGRTGTVIFRLEGDAIGARLGTAVAAAGDVDADGVPDFVAGAPQAQPGGITFGGSAFVYSGLDGSVLHRFDARQVELHGSSVAGAGDLNGDGNADLLIGSPVGNFNGLPDSGSVFAYSGLDGSILWRVDGPAMIDELGSSLISAGDLDGDSIPDAAAGAANADPGGIESAGSVFLYSGADGSLIGRLDGTETGAQFGAALAIAGDLDADGNLDLLVGAPHAGTGRGAAFVVSTTGGAPLLQVLGAAIGDNLGAAVALVGDTDGDGGVDLALGCPGADLFNGAVSVHSGTTGAQICRHGGSTNNGRFGAALAPLGDLEGDGFAEFLAGEPGRPGGAVAAIGLNPYLTATAEEISVAAGGTVVYSIRFPAAAADRGYALLVSGAGTGPTDVNGVTLPLGNDALLLRSLAGRLPDIATGFRGRLDSAGDASARFDLQPGRLHPNFRDRLFHLAAVDATGEFVSVARALLVLP